MQPPVSVLQSLLNLCIEEKQFVKLADVIKLTAGKEPLLDKTFCQKSLVELRRWGRDPDAISAAYKSLRKVDESSGYTAPAITAPSTSDKFNHTHKKMINICRRSSVNLPVSCPSPPPPPPLPSQLPRRSLSTTAKFKTDEDSSASEGVDGLSSADCDKPEILKLIEVYKNVATTACTVANPLFGWGVGVGHCMRNFIDHAHFS